LWELAEMEPLEELLRRNQYYTDIPVTAEIENLKTFILARKQLQYNEQLKQLAQFKASLHKVRRLLANTPTYMLLDDHDITDDWNINETCKNKVWEAPLGRHVIANGLAPYWAFQGGGNNPGVFNITFIGIMENRLQDHTLGA
jgi:hypothetical protein